MTIVDIYYSDPHRGVIWVEYRSGGETGWRPIDLETALVLQRKLAQAVQAAKAAQESHGR